MSDQTKDQLSRWLPTAVAVLAIVGNIGWVSREAGKLEQRVIYLENAHASAITRPEYDTRVNATAQQLGDLKQQLREISAKLDYLSENPRR